MIKFLDIQKITDSFEPELSNAINRVVKSGRFLLGDEVSNFEAEYAEYIGSGCCIGVGNGLDALRLILKAYIKLGFMKEGDEVIVPANTYIASILAITDNRLVPIFVEPDINTYNLDICLIEQHITPRTRAVMVVHLYGQACWSHELEEISVRYHLKIIEDNAQASGTMVRASINPVIRFNIPVSVNENNEHGIYKRTGSLGHAAGHSFYPGKNLGALGDGGAVTTDDDELATYVRAMANYGSARKYVHDYEGLNSRLDEIQAAVLRVKLHRLDADNKRRRMIAEYYLKNINNSDIILPKVNYIHLQADNLGNNFNYSTNEEFMMPLDHIWHLFVIRSSFRNKVQEYLTSKGIETLIHYPLPPHRQAALKEFNKLSLPITEQISSEILSLPLSPFLENEEASLVVEAINNALI